MIKPEVEEIVSINCTKEFFKRKIEEIFKNLGKGGNHYKVETPSPDTVKVTSKRFIYRKINLSEIIFNIVDENGKLKIHYRVNFFRWFLGLIFLSITLLISFAIFYFFFNNKYHPQMETSHYVIIFGSIFFWAFIWPLIMTFFYKNMVKNFMQKVLGLIEAQYLIIQNKN
ncbi:hypothetical protein TTHT_2023 [Thermotomaculum hydrothermale]|uniref:Uncharacterized protein n=1 Tax=Thermotomaculum hydrothermale TaxID=981385 RepID=A0A7R6SZ43_9BACT|nr:hypothetical protein [Thermotomaculum hydrothermale]BBB33464.1 hypothetical protein TTHT_2023 [Thermotomaculum hydrothermale]